jgi:hypothetical protein
MRLDTKRDGCSQFAITISATSGTNEAGTADKTDAGHDCVHDTQAHAPLRRARTHNQASARIVTHRRLQRREYGAHQHVQRLKRVHSNDYLGISAATQDLQQRTE